MIRFSMLSTAPLLAALALAEEGILVRNFLGATHARQMRISIGDGPALTRAADLILSFLKKGH